MSDASATTVGLYQDPVYTPLPGRARRYFGVPFLFELLFTFGVVPFAPRYRLYRADDHLLYVRRQLFGETAKRFYFYDIQSITLIPTKGRPLAAFFLIIIPLLLMLLGFIVNMLPLPFTVKMTFDTVAGVCLLGSIILQIPNVLLGATCKVEITTATHRERLYCLGRMHAALKTLERIAPDIQAAQGILPWNAALPETGPETPPVALTPAALFRGPRPEAVKSFPEREDGAARLCGYLFGLLLVSGGIVLIDLAVYSHAKNALDAALFVLGMTLGCVALGRAAGTSFPREFRWMIALWLAANWGFVIVANTLYGIYLGFFSAGDISKLYSTVMDQQAPFFLVFSCIEGGINIIVAAAGFLALRRYWAGRRDREGAAA